MSHRPGAPDRHRIVNNYLAAAEQKGTPVRWPSRTELDENGTSHDTLATSAIGEAEFVKPLDFAYIYEQQEKRGSGNSKSV